MKLLLKLRDMCYYEYKGEVIWVKNKLPYIERKVKDRIQSLKDRGYLYETDKDN